MGGHAVHGTVDDPGQSHRGDAVIDAREFGFEPADGIEPVQVEGLDGWEARRPGPRA